MKLLVASWLKELIARVEAFLLIEVLGVMGVRRRSLVGREDERRLQEAIVAGSFERCEEEEEEGNSAGRVSSMGVGCTGELEDEYDTEDGCKAGRGNAADAGAAVRNDSRFVVSRDGREEQA